MIIVPLPSPDCNTDWNYNEHGANWQCRCPVGREQSPIPLENPWTYDLVKYNAEWKYETVPKNDIDVVYELNMIRFKIKDKKTKTFGGFTDIDGTEYKSYEIRIHTPAEHFIMGEPCEMEV